MIATGADYFVLGHIHWALPRCADSGKLLGCYPGALRGRIGLRIRRIKGKKQSVAPYEGKATDSYLYKMLAPKCNHLHIHTLAVDLQPHGLP
jgi:hypothetical protein